MLISKIVYYTVFQNLTKQTDKSSTLFYLLRSQFVCLSFCKKTPEIFYRVNNDQERSLIFASELLLLLIKFNFFCQQVQGTELQMINREHTALQKLVATCQCQVLRSRGLCLALNVYHMIFWSTMKSDILIGKSTFCNIMRNCQTAICSIYLFMELCGTYRVTSPKIDCTEMELC